MNNAIRFPIRFFIATFVWSWLLWIPLALCGQGVIAVSPKLLSGMTMPVAILGAFGPLAGALFSLRKEQGKGSAIQYLRSFLDIRLGWKAYVYPLLILGGSTAIAWLLPEFYGEERLPMLFPSVWIFIPYLVMMIFLGGGQEEFGWRGYALPRLEERYGIWIANILLGIVWAFWHLPLWFIPGASQMYMNFGGFIFRSLCARRRQCVHSFHAYTGFAAGCTPTPFLDLGNVDVHYWNSYYDISNQTIELIRSSFRTSYVFLQQTCNLKDYGDILLIIQEDHILYSPSLTFFALYY